MELALYGVERKERSRGGTWAAYDSTTAAAGHNIVTWEPPDSLEYIQIRT